VANLLHKGTSPASQLCDAVPDLRESLELLGVRSGAPETLPFALADATAGSETELQAAVLGDARSADLPRTIRDSRYFANVLRRAEAGDTPRRAVSRLEEYLDNNPTNLWENSWVRFPLRALNAYAKAVLDQDLRADKGDPSSGYRSDAERFLPLENGVEFVRVPVSYLVKLALADVLFAGGRPTRAVRAAAVRLMPHFLNDNTSPETHSFHIVSLDPHCGYGRQLAKETAKRYLFTHLLTLYANRKFQLRENGQEAIIFFSPHPPVRQKHLNDCISDAFYRELFMSPCLSGWDDGEAKHEYMVLCHQVLSRSHLNAVGKLREAGIITRNLVVLPNTSNISLANNGLHVTLGSQKLTRTLRDPNSGFTAAHEKHTGDLVIKIVEHFLPLFVGMHSAAPYRLDFADFHPERVLGFLSHELDYTHLRMLWRRWKKRAKNRVLGHPMTPAGPELVDRMLTFLFRLKGDFVPDFRLIDYLVALMSTEESPALDGRLASADRLKKDLDDLGVFDRRMSMYLPYKLRPFAALGFSGFEGRYYSLFESLRDDMTHAVNLQGLITVLAFKYIAGGWTHADIPDRPLRESERRQVFFGAATGVPTFYVHENTDNRFLLKILQQTKGLRHSHRYPGYLRVELLDYRCALLETVARDGADLIEMMRLGPTIDDLRARIEDPKHCSGQGKLTKGILAGQGAKSPFQLRAQEFNSAAERYYREDLRRKHFSEALDFVEEDLPRLSQQAQQDPETRESLAHILQGMDLPVFFSQVRQDWMSGASPENTLRRLVHLMLVMEFAETRAA